MPRLSVAGAGVPAARIGDAAHRILCKRGGSCTEAQEGDECKDERPFHVELLWLKVTTEDGLGALHDKRPQVRSVVAKPTYDQQAE